MKAVERPVGACTIFGGGSIWEIDENLKAVERILEAKDGSAKDLRDLEVIKEETRRSDEELVTGVREIFGKWIDYGFTSPDKGWDIVTKSMTVQDTKTEATE